MSNLRQTTTLLAQTPWTAPTADRRLLRAVRIIAVLCPLTSLSLIAYTVSASLRGPCGHIHLVAMVVGGAFGVLLTLPYLHVLLRLRPSEPSKEAGLALATVIGSLGFVIAVLLWPSLETAQKWLDPIWALTQGGLAVVAFAAYRSIRTEMRHKWAFRMAAGWAMGWVMWVVICLVALIAVAAMVIPNLLKSCPGGVAHQASAVGSLRTINTSEVAYSSTYTTGFSATLAELDGTASPSTAQSAGLIDSALGSGMKSTYRFVYTPGPKDKEGRINSYAITASPVGGAGNGNFYFTDQSGVIRMNNSQTATATDSPLAG